MIERKIILKTINDVKEFVNAVNCCDFSIDLSSGRYTVDGKSIMGIFSLNLSNPITLVAYTDDLGFVDTIKSFIIE